MTIRTRFDGRHIVLPKELEGHDPCDVEIVVADGPFHNGASTSSIWDAVAESKGRLSGAEIVRESSTERDSWECA